MTRNGTSMGDLRFYHTFAVYYSKFIAKNNNWLFRCKYILLQWFHIYILTCLFFCPFLIGMGVREGSLNRHYRPFEEDILALFEHSFTSKHFSFGEQFYEHTDVVAYGISTVSSYHQLLDGRFQGKYSRTNDKDKPLCCFHYVDGMFVIWRYRPEELEWFVYHLNGFRRNIQFTLWRWRETTTILFLILTSVGDQVAVWTMRSTESLRP